MSEVTNKMHYAWSEFKELNNKRPSIIIIGKRAFDELRNELHASRGGMLQHPSVNDEDYTFLDVRLVVSNRLDDISMF